MMSVSDKGPGIPPEGIARLFTPFDRLGAENSGVEGTGLGLVLSRQFVEVMGGTMGVESRVGEGSTFWIEIGLVENQPGGQSIETCSGPIAYECEQMV